MSAADPNQIAGAAASHPTPMMASAAMNPASAGGDIPPGIPGVRSAFPGERGTPNLKQNKRKNSVSKLFFVLAIFVALAAMAIGTAMFLKRLQTQHEETRAEAKKTPKASSSDGGHDFATDADRLRRERAAAAQQASMAAAASAADAARVPPPSGALQANAGAPAAAGRGDARGQAPHVETLAEREMDGDVLVPTSSGAGSHSDTSGKSDSIDRPIPTRAPSNGLDGQLTPSSLASVRPSFLPDLDYLLKRGEVIPCGQRTQINTTYPGMTSCIVSKDVYSADGRTLLIEAGSEATGEQRTAVMQGQARIFVLWSRLDMPNGVTVPLNSPGTDSLGATGLDAFVDTHFWQRFGGALMVSLIGDLGQAASSRSIGSGNNQIQLSNTSSQGQGLAEETLKNTINIPPTAFSNHGSQLNIFVARDVDFRSVYELEQQ